MKLRMLLLCAGLALSVVVATASGGVAPSLVFIPGAKDFGTIDKNTTTSQTFVLTNGGGTSGAVSVSLSGSSAFSTTADTCTGANLNSKKQCSVTVQYAPTADGSSDSGTLTAGSKKSSAVATASLSGKSTPPCTAGSENFSGYAEKAQPTTFAGGTIDTSYGSLGGVLIQGTTNWWLRDVFTTGTHLLYTGFDDVLSLTLSFTAPVGYLQVEAYANSFTTQWVTLTAYDTNNNVVGTTTQTHFPNLLELTSNSNNIKHFTISGINDTHGVGFSNIIWTCN